MIGKDDANSVGEDLHTRWNSRDSAQIDALNAKQAEVHVEFLKQADEYGIDPEPIPHTHTPHEELSRRCLSGFLLATFGGIFVAILLTAGAVSNRLLGALGAALIFVAAEVVVDLGVSAVSHRKQFMDNFRWFYLPPLLLFFISLSIILLGRLATPEMADQLLNITAYTWWGLETALPPSGLSPALATTGSVGVGALTVYTRPARRVSSTSGSG